MERKGSYGRERIEGRIERKDREGGSRGSSERVASERE
jgi:hypothetical protein